MVFSLVAYSWFYQGELFGNYLNVVLGMNDYLQTQGYQLEDAHSLWGAVTLACHSQSPVVVKSKYCLVVTGCRFSVMGGRLVNQLL